MPKLNLSAMSVDQLLKLRTDLEALLSSKADQLRNELSKLGGHNKSVGGSSLKGRKIAVKYRDKSGNTWAGRGVQPRWLRERLKARAKLEQFAVDKQHRAKR